MKTKTLVFVLMLAISGLGFGQNVKYQLSSHILDITRGMPATSVKISLSKQDAKGLWHQIDEKFTDENGRIPDFLKVENGNPQHGIFKLTFYTEPYFKSLEQTSFYPFIDVVFEIQDDNHYHVPITLSAFGYSTYRGN